MIIITGDLVPDLENSRESIEKQLQQYDTSLEWFNPNIKGQCSFYMQRIVDKYKKESHLKWHQKDKVSTMNKSYKTSSFHGKSIEYYRNVNSL